MRIPSATILGLALLAPPAWAECKIDEATKKAWEKHQKGRPDDEVLKDMQKAASQCPGGEGQLGLSRFQLRLGGAENLDAGLASARKAVEESAAGAPAIKGEALAHLATLELRMASSKDALAHAEQAVQAQATATTLSTLARAQVRSGLSAKALETAEKAIQAGATSGAAWGAKGVALRSLERYDEAIAAYRKALEVEPGRHRARIGLAVALLEAGNAKEAEAEARKAVDETSGDPKDEEGLAALGLAILATNPSDGATWNRAIEQAQTGNFQNPKSPVVKYSVGKIFEQNGRLDEAANNYKAALEVDPAFIKARQALIQVLVWQKKVPEAMALAQKTAAENPDNPEAQLFMGQLKLRSQDYAGSIPYLEKAGALSPTQPEIWIALGAAYRLSGDLQKAAASYKKGLDLNASNSDLRVAYADVLGALKQFDAAAVEYKKIAEAPGYKDPLGWIKLAWVYRSLTPPKVDDAVAAYKKALVLDPKNEQAAMGIGRTYYSAKRYDEAIAAFQQALKVSADVTGEAELSIAWCYVAKRDAANAKVHMEKASAAGKPEPKLKEAVEKLEKGQATEARAEMHEEGVDLSQCSRQLMAKDPNARRAAVKCLCGAGRDAVSQLVFVVANDGEEAKIRGQALECLCKLGPAAREVVPYLRQIIITEPAVILQPTKKQLEEEAEFHDLQNQAKACLPKVQR